MENITKFRVIDKLTNQRAIMHGLGEAELSALSWANGSSLIKSDLSQAEGFVQQYFTTRTNKGVN